jgi:hypothetical protein
MTAADTFSCLTFAALCLTSASGARADDPFVRRALVAAHARQVRADTGGSVGEWRQMYKALCAPGFTFTMADGKTLSRTEFGDAQIHALAMVKGSREAFTIQRVTRTGDRATEAATRTFRIVLVDPKGKSHVLTGRNVFRAEWVKTGPGWQAQHVKEISDQEMIDGKPTTTH